MISGVTRHMLLHLSGVPHSMQTGPKRGWVTVAHGESLTFESVDKIQFVLPFKWNHFSSTVKGDI